MSKDGSFPSRPRSGLPYLVQTDMRSVLDLVADQERPLVVVVDDVDRCSSSAATQVIEAINLFLAGEFPNCIFVIALDPEVVVSHIEVAYHDIVEKLRLSPGSEGNGASSFPAMLSASRPVLHSNESR